MSAPALANLGWLLSSLPAAVAFRRAAENVEGTQTAVLRGIISSNVETDFGRRHRFESIDTAEAFQRLVPLATNAVQSADIARAANGEPGVLTHERITHFVPTSGTTAASRLVPFTRSLQHEMQNAIGPWLVDLFLTNPGMLSGTAYWSLSPALQGRRKSAGGIDIGFAADDEYFGPLRRYFVRSLQSVPAELAEIADFETFRHALLFFLLADRRLSFLSIWNPTFLTLLLAPLRELAPVLVLGIASGIVALPSVVAPAIAARLAREARARRSVSRASEIERALEHESDAAMHAALWPRLRVISCWMDANAAQPARQLAALFPQATLQPKGLLSTEGFVSFPLSAANGAVLAIRSHFYEFQELGSERVLLAHQLQAGARYSVILTNGGGLYRHGTGDVIEVTGFHRSCPVVRFLGRAQHVDHFGEKLSEAHVSEAIRATVPDCSFAMLARDGGSNRYALFVKSALSDTALIDAAKALDASLRANPHYAYCRDLHQLEAIGVFRISGSAAAAYLAGSMARGLRAGDVKPVAVHADDDWSRWFQGSFIDESQPIDTRRVSS
jgi:hypothetical protein